MVVGSRCSLANGACSGVRFRSRREQRANLAERGSAREEVTLVNQEQVA